MTLAGYTDSHSEPAVTILMGTLNGARFLAEQLASIERQSYQNWHLVVSDDGSTDRTPHILSEFVFKMGPDRVTIRSGPAKGFVRNYLQLVCDEAIEGDFFAFGDQDDIWATDKLARALEWLTKVPPSVPALYCSRTKIIDAAGNEVGLSRLFTGRPTFANALVQSIAGGNTMVFNKATRRLIRLCGATDPPTHDWLAYLLVTATEGAINYDAYPGVRYRLHADNAIGSPLWSQRVNMMLNNQFRIWITKNLAILHSFRPHMTQKNRIIFDEFSKIRKDHVVDRISALYRSGVYRTSLMGNTGLLASVLLGKL